jgi:hypothetical protein
MYHVANKTAPNLGVAMTHRRFRWLSVGLAASGGAGLLALTSMMNSAFAYGDDSVIGLVMGGTGNPTPGSGYVGNAYTYYIEPNYPATPEKTLEVVTTPEQLYPLTPPGTQYLNYPISDGFPSDTSSVGQGLAALEGAITGNQEAGDTSTVFGYSQSSIISSLAMEQLDPSGTPEPDSGLQFVLTADIMNPNGGVLERFDGLTLPSVGIDFAGATPADDFPTVIYTAEYDGFADFPQYPLNFLSDLNAVLGVVLVHPTYVNDAGSIDFSDAIQLSTSGATETTYYMIPETAPLVSLLGDIPLVGKPLEALLGPDLTVLIDLGYGSTSMGYSDTAANIPTQFGLFPDVSPSAVLSALESGAVTGFQDFESAVSAEISDIESGGLSSLLDTSSISLSSVFGTSSVSLSYLLGALVNIADAELTSIPAYDVSLFTDSLSSGNLLDAIGLPIAADTGLYTLLDGMAGLLLAEAL